MNNYKISKGIWKAVRIIAIAAVSFLLANIQDWIPPEYATPAIIGGVEFFRNLIFAEHRQSLLAK